MQKSFITINSKQTQKLGEMLAQEILADKKLSFSRPKRPKEAELLKPLIICLDGELGAGKTTFTQGLLKGLKIKGPYTSPTFLIMKQYENVYHIDAYRVEAQDILNLGWEEIISNLQNIVIIEWAQRIEKILPKNILQISFEWQGENKRKIIFSVKSEK